MTFFGELKRRNGFIPALIISWVFELTPDGLRREDESAPADAIDSNEPNIARRMNRMIIVVLLLALGYFAFDKFILLPNRDAVAAAPNTAAPINSIAVLPFQNKNSDADTEYLSDGLAESLIFRLAQLPNLKVSPSSSIFRYKGKDIDPVKVGAELGVSAVMSGRLVQRGDDLSISVELLDVRNNTLLWGEQYNRKMSELLATQREIAVEITNKLQLKLTGNEVASIEKKYTTSNDAYQAYLKGRFYWNKRDSENLKKAIEQFNIAVEKDPNYALAYVGLADSYIVSFDVLQIPFEEAVSRVKAYANKALQLDASLGEAYATLGRVNAHLWKWEESEKAYKRSIELNPNYATARHWYSRLLVGLERRDEALLQIKRANEIDPLSPIIIGNIALRYREMGDYQSALDQCNTLIELDPRFASAYWSLGWSLLKLGRNDEAIANFEKSVELSKRDSLSLGLLGYGYATTGKRTEANAIANELEGMYSKNKFDGFTVAMVYAGLGDKNKAFEWLEKDFQIKGNLGEIKILFPIESLHDDPRYQDLLKRMGLPVEQTKL